MDEMNSYLTPRNATTANHKFTFQNKRQNSFSNKGQEVGLVSQTVKKPELSNNTSAGRKVLLVPSHAIQTTQKPAQHELMHSVYFPPSQPCQVTVDGHNRKQISYIVSPDSLKNNFVQVSPITGARTGITANKPSLGKPGNMQTAIGNVNIGNINFANFGSGGGGFGSSKGSTAYSKSIPGILYNFENAPHVKETKYY